MALTYKNQSAEGRIERNTKEVKKALLELIQIKNLPSYDKLSKFIIRRMYDFNINFEFKAILKIVKTVKKEYSLSSIYFYQYVFYVFYLNYSKGKSTMLKRYFNL